MNRSALLGLVALAGVAAGVGITASMDLAATVEAAPGDLTVTPRSDSSTFQLEEVCLNRGPYAAVRFRNGLGQTREVVVRNGPSTGYDYPTDAPLNVTTASGFTQFRAALGVTGATMTAASNWLRTNGVLTGTSGAQ